MEAPTYGTPLAGNQEVLSDRFAQGRAVCAARMGGVAPAGGKGWWLVSMCPMASVSMCPMVSVSRRAMSTRTTLGSAGARRGFREPAAAGR